MDKSATFEELIQPARGVILDFDGLLADSEKYHFFSYREVFGRYGHNVDEEEYYKYWTSLGHGAKGEIQRHGLDLDPHAIRVEKQPIFSQYCENGSIEMFPEAIDMLCILSESAKLLAIASGSFRKDIHAVLRNAGVDSLIKVIIGSDTVPQIKPAPDVFLKALEVLDLDAKDVVVLEDAEKGMMAARAAGLPVIIVRTPETKDFDFSDADLVLDSHAELIALVRTAFP